MKRVVFISVLLSVLTAATAPAQLRPGRVELSTAVSLQLFTDEGESFFVGNIPLRVGIFVMPNFAVEPEVILTFVEDEDMGYLVSANLAYHVPLRKAAIFILGGVGHANSVPFHNTANSILGGFETSSAVFINGGIGAKIFLTDSAALRNELRFQNFFWENDSEQYFSLFMGFSVFVP